MTYISRNIAPTRRRRSQGMMTEAMATAVLTEARRLAAMFLTNQGQEQNARIVASGNGDDFPEVQAIHLTLSEQADRMTRYEQALDCYARDDFWEDISGGSLAEHDRGEMARNVLAGRTPFRDVC